MRYSFLVLLLFISLPALAQNTTAQSVSQDNEVLVRSIEMDGFVLGDKDQFVKLFKPYRNKYLSKDDLDAILQKIRVIYEREGYQELVTISYQVVKHHLVFTALMTT